MTDEKRLLQMIEDCEKNEDRLSQWERNFIQSISELDIDKPLTERQIKKITDIWEKVT